MVSNKIKEEKDQSRDFRVTLAATIIVLIAAIIILGWPQKVCAAEEEEDYAVLLTSSLRDELRRDAFTDEFIIGLISNVISEGGKNGAVQWQFSAEKAYGFALPSGGNKVQTREDVDYLLNWTTSDAGSVDGLPLKGSCGVSALQWSYERRITWCNILIEVIGDADIITQEDILLADVKMFAYELSGATWADFTSNRSAAEWADVICRIYVAPKDMEWAVSYRRDVAVWLTSREDIKSALEPKIARRQSRYLAA